MPEATPEELENFANSIARKMLGMNLTEKQERFLELIQSNGLRVRITKEARATEDFRELIDLLSAMYKSGIIPSLELVDV